jgi:hypothetical protein
MIQVTWTDAKGAGRMRAFERTSQATDFLRTLRREATVRDSSGEVVGGIELIPEAMRTGRTKWGWWIDSEAE